jgi:hypothetical protein
MIRALLHSVCKALFTAVFGVGFQPFGAIAVPDCESSAENQSLPPINAELRARIEGAIAVGRCRYDRCFSFDTTFYVGQCDCFKLPDYLALGIFVLTIFLLATGAVDMTERWRKLYIKLDSK